MATASSSRFAVRSKAPATAAAPLRETEDFVQKWGEAGALAVDAECSTFFTVACFDGIKAGAVLAVSDQPAEVPHLRLRQELDARCRRPTWKL